MTEEEVTASIKAAKQELEAAKQELEDVTLQLETKLRMDAMLTELEEIIAQIKDTRAEIACKKNAILDPAIYNPNREVVLPPGRR